jgi:hypothetical protein
MRQATALAMMLVMVLAVMLAMLLVMAMVRLCLKPRQQTASTATAHAHATVPENSCNHCRCIDTCQAGGASGEWQEVNTRGTKLSPFHRSVLSPSPVPAVGFSQMLTIVLVVVRHGGSENSRSHCRCQCRCIDTCQAGEGKK